MSDQELKNISQSISDSFAQIAERSTQAAKETIEAWGSDFKARLESELKAAKANLPTLTVKIGDKSEVKLSRQASPYLERLIVNAKLGLHSMLVGPAGCGKTSMSEQLAEALSLPFYSVCLTAGASETWLFGRQTPNGFVEGPFSKAYRNGGVFLADEMDAADANLLLSINTALSHHELSNPMSGETIKRHKDFVFIAAANTNGKGATHVYTGRSRLDAATLDRFVIITVDYDLEVESLVCPDKRIVKFLLDVRKELKDASQDEFISTRAFKNTYLQMQAGTSIEAIKNSLTANWGDAARELLEDAYLEHFPKSEAKAIKSDFDEAMSMPSEAKQVKPERSGGETREQLLARLAKARAAKAARAAT